MSETAALPDVRRAKRRQLFLLIAAIVIGLGVLYGAIALFARGRAGGPADLKPLATGGMSKMAVLDKPQPALLADLSGPDGKPLDAAALKGKVVIVNLWATWCPPCRQEMPTLARLQAAYAGKPVVVAAVSTDGDDDLPKARAFIASNAPLGFYHAPSAWPFKLTPPAAGLPTTLIIDKTGQERARVTGQAEWAGGEAKKVVDALLNEKG